MQGDDQQPASAEAGPTATDADAGAKTGGVAPASQPDAAPAEAGGDALDALLRDRLLSKPELLLGDRDLMRALIGARDSENGENVIDIRGRAMQVLEERLDRLESAHESVISAAYDNQSGMNMVHRAVLALLEPIDFASFVEGLQSHVAPILRVETLRLVFESAESQSAEPGHGLQIVPVGTIVEMIRAGRRAPRGDDIILRPASPITESIHGGDPGQIRSEALIPLDLGPGRRPALIVIGSTDGQRFAASQGTDLLRFFAQVFRLVLLGWLRE